MNDERKKRRRLIRKYPAYSLAECLVIPNIIFSENAGLPLSRILLAKKIGTSANSSSFTTKLAACEEYGVTEGRYKDETIRITSLGTAIAASKDKNEYSEALTIALNKPEIFGKLNSLIGNSEIPEDELLRNIAIRDLGIHHDQTEEFVEIIKANKKLSPIYSKSPKKYISSGTVQEEKEHSQVKTPSDNESQSTATTKKILIMSVEESSEIVVTLEKHFANLNLQTIQVNLKNLESALIEYERTQIACSLVVPKHGSDNQDIENIYALGLAEASTSGPTLYLGRSPFPPNSYSNPSLTYISDDDINLLFLKLLELFVAKGVADVILPTS